MSELSPDPDAVASPEGSKSEQGTADWRSWLQLVLALVPIIGAVSVSFIFADNERQAVANIETQVQPLQLSWQFHQIGTTVSAAFTALEAAAHPEASAEVVALADEYRQAAVPALDTAVANTGVYLDSLADSFGGDTSGFVTIIEQTFSGAGRAFALQEAGQPVSPQLRAITGQIESRFAGGGSVASDGWDLDSVARVELYEDVSLYHSAWLVEQRELVVAALQRNRSFEALLEPQGLTDASSDRQRWWLQARFDLTALASVDNYVLRADGAPNADPVAELLVEAKAARNLNERLDILILGGLRISELAATDLETAQRVLSESAVDRADDRRRVQLTYVIAALILVLLGGALLLMTRAEILRRRRVERAHADALQRLDTKASRDPLTGVWNRRRLDSRVDELLERRDEVGSLVLAYVDLDRFKAINDVWGHSTGDRVLQVASTRLAAVEFRGDRLEVVRSGGDEFVCYAAAAQPTDDEIAELGRALIAAVEQPVSIDGRTHRLGATAGLSVSDVGATRASLMFEADSSMLLAKRHQRGSATIYNRTTSRSSQLVQELPDALVDGQIRCWYQPVYSLKTGEISHVEALARWLQPTGEIISPAEFIPLVETFGMASALSEVAMRNAADEQARSGGRRVWINIAPVELDMIDFAERFLRTATALNVDPQRLGLEITETAAVSDPVHLANQLADLRAVGITIAIDDFGNGYSPLGYLQQLPVDVVKLDRSLIDRIDTERANQHIVRGVVALCQEIGVTTVAEGVERSEELEWLRDHGVDQVQGFLMARPMPSADLDWNATMELTSV